MSDERPQIRLAELVATLSLGTDLGLGQPMEHVIRQTLIALRMSERLGLDESDRAVVYYAGLLAWIGCHTDAYEQAKWFGDDIALKADGFQIAELGPSFLLSHLGAGRPLRERARLGIELLRAARRGDIIDLGSHWLAADGLAQRHGLGEAIRLTSRLFYLADVVAVFHRTGGIDAAIRVAQERSGSHFDPALVDLFCEQAPALLSGLDVGLGWKNIVAAEPRLARLVLEEQLDGILEAIADFTDLRSPYLIGHSRSVAALARRLPSSTDCRRATWLPSAGQGSYMRSVDSASPTPSGISVGR